MMYDGGKDAGYTDEVGGLLGVMLEEEREGLERAVMSSMPENLNYIHNLDVNTPPRRVITFSDL